MTEQPNHWNNSGTDSQNPVQMDVPPEQKISTLAVVGLICGIFGLCFCPLGIVALILGIIALAQIADPARALAGRGMAVVAIVFGVLSFTLTPFLIGIMLPALNAARRAAMQMENTNQVRSIVQSMTANNYPSFDSRGNPVDLTVEGRFAEMLDQNYISPQLLINPAEVKTVWMTGPVTTGNYSYALLDISDPGGRQYEWKSPSSFNPLAVVISDRNTGASSSNTDVMSVFSYSPGHWQGSTAYADGSATFNHDHKLDVQYGKGPVYYGDNIFEAASNDDAMMIYSGQ